MELEGSRSSSDSENAKTYYTSTWVRHYVVIISIPGITLGHPWMRGTYPRGRVSRCWPPRESLSEAHCTASELSLNSVKHHTMMLGHRDSVPVPHSRPQDWVGGPAPLWALRLRWPDKIGMACKSPNLESESKPEKQNIFNRATLVERSGLQIPSTPLCVMRPPSHPNDAENESLNKKSSYQKPVPYSLKLRLGTSML